MVYMQERKRELCAAEISVLQVDIEREVSSLAALSQLREEEGRAGRITRLLQQKISAKRRKIRELMAMWQIWSSMASSTGEACCRCRVGYLCGAWRAYSCYHCMLTCTSV